MVMPDFICIGSADLFGTEKERKILWLQYSGVQINKTITWQHVSNWLYVFELTVRLNLNFLSSVDLNYYNNCLQNIALAIKQ